MQSGTWQFVQMHQFLLQLFSMKFSKTWIYAEWYLAVCTNAACAFLCYFGAAVTAPPVRVS